MLDELYDDVLSIMTENGFVHWFEKNHGNKISPLKWCYDTECNLKSPKTPPKGITWVVNTYDGYQYFPHTKCIDDNGSVSPRN